MSAKLVFSWILGGVFLLLGIWIGNNLEFTIGVSEASYAIAMVVALIFILIGGLLWINVSVAVKNRF
jgi:membrane protein DedA with SNARE-associated domain